MYKCLSVVWGIYYITVEREGDRKEVMTTVDISNHY